MTEPVLVVDQASVGYGRPGRRPRVVLADVNAAAPAGRLTCLVGANGSGKSTLLRSLARFQPLLGGDVRVDGQSVRRCSARELARTLAVVLTDRVAPGQLRAYDVVSLGRYPHTGFAGRLGRADNAVVERSLEQAGASHLAGRVLSELSDGERQRVMIARALAQEPRVLLLDEPSAFLDVRGRLELTASLMSLTHEHGLAVVMSTHDLEHLIRHADFVWLVDAGRRLTTGAPEDLGLDGSLRRALAGTVPFDPLTGRFGHDRPPVGRVRLVGHGETHDWTCRALRRVGFHVADDDTAHDLEVVCRPENGNAHWSVRHGQHRHDVSSLGDLVDKLRTLSAPADVRVG
jgi:iron complex transport system ATP-binding protein